MTLTINVIRSARIQLAALHAERARLAATDPIEFGGLDDGDGPECTPAECLQNKEDAIEYLDRRIDAVTFDPCGWYYDEPPF